MVESVVPAIQLVVVLGLFGLLIRPRRRLSAIDWATYIAAAAGALVLLLASVEQLYFLGAPGIALLGIAWLGAARLVPSRALAVLTATLGVVALLEAVDAGLFLLPVPLGPVWVRVVLELAWVIWVGISLVKARRGSGGPMSLRPSPSR